MGLLRRSTPPRPRRQRFRISQPNALTASATSLGVQDAREAAAKSQAPVGSTVSRIERALAYYDSLGECWYPAQFYARSMKRVRYFPALLNDEGEPEEVDSGPLRDLFDRIHDPGGTSMAQLASNYGRLAFLIGDGNLIVSEQEGEEVWEYLSPLELKRQRGTSPQEYERNNGIEKETLVEAGPNEPIRGNKVRVWRLWRRHPTRSGWSDAPVLSQLENYALLERLTLAVGATSWSRAATRDMLYLPDEVDLGGQDDDPNDPGVDEDPMADSSVRELVEAFTSAISDPGSVEGASPIMLRGPAAFIAENGQALPFASLIARIQVGRDNPYYETDAWPAVIERIALGLDMPNEMVTGTGKVNHWGGWLLDEQGFRQHVAGVVEDFCDDIASAYLRPQAVAENIPDADRVVVWYDPVAAVAHPDEAPTAKDAWENGAIGRESYRKAAGFADEDAPTEEDEAFLLELKGRRSADPAAADGETAPQDGGTGGDANEAPPAEPSNGNGDAVAASAAHVKAAMILGAAEMQIRQARKAAGARLVQRSKNCGDCQDAIRDVPLGLVASTLGTARVREIINGHTDEAALVCGVGDLLAEQVREFGVRGPYPEQLGAMVESHALRTLYEGESPRLPAGFAAAVAKALR